MLLVLISFQSLLFSKVSKCCCFIFIQEETLPLKDDILDDIVREVIGINPDKLAIEIDPSGREFVVEQNEDDDERLASLH